MSWPVHPAAEWFPLLESSELEDLATDIAANGLLTPVTLWEDPDRGTVLLDGRNRLAASVEAGVKIRTVFYEGTDPFGFVISQNVRRRHLTTGQLAAIATTRIAHHQAEAAKRMLLGVKPEDPSPDLGKGRAADAAASEVGTSGTSVENFRKVEKERPDLAEKVKAGELSLDRAYQQVRGAYKPKVSRADQIRPLAASGHLSTQIAEKIGVQAEYVREIAKREGIALPDTAIGRVHKIEPNRVVSETVAALEGLALGVSLINGEVQQLDLTRVEGWTTSLTSSLRSLNRFHKQLKEVAR